MRAREFVREDADGQQVLDYIHGTHHEPLTKQLQQAVLSYPRWELRSVPVSSLHIPDQEYDDEEQEPEADPYNRVQAIDPDHAGEYSANFVDRRPIVVDSEGWIIDGNHRAWAASELLNRSTIRAWVPASQLNELGNAPADYKPNRKRSRSLFHATVDGQWVDVFFDRSEFNGTLHITFAVNGDYDAPEQPTSASKSTVKILSTVLNIVKKQLPEYMAKARPPAISFTSKQDNRTSLYRKYFVPVIQNILGAKWQHEEYPSMGMTVFHWKPVKKSGVTEAFDQPYAIQWTKQNGDWHATADLDDGSELIVLFMSQGDNQWMVEFERDENMEITGEGDAPRVFATVLTAMQQFIAKRKPAMLNFSAEKEDDPTGSRARLYDRMIQRYISGTGYDLTRKDVLGGATYTLTRTQQDVAEDAENFNGIDISMEVEGDEIMVRATAGGRELGHVLFVEDGEYLMPQDLEVEERFQGQGIAAAMYDYVKSKGYKIRRSGQQTDAGAGFWRKNRGEENVWENFADGRNPQDKGDSKRYGVPTKASVSTLRKVAKQGGRKGQLAHWMANMKAGRAKANKK
jgi:GNAT superfamily N-acetyltransferase